MAQLQPFSFFKATTPQSVYTTSCTLVEFEGNYSGPGGEYLLVFDKASAAVANDVPIIVIPLPTAGPTPIPTYTEIMGCIPLYLGLSIAVSTTEEKLTTTTSSFTITGAIEEQNPPVIQGLSTASVAGGVALLQAYTSDATPNFGHAKNHVYEVTVTSAEGQNEYIQIWAASSYATTSFTVNGVTGVRMKPLVSVLITDGQTIKLRFGKNGLPVVQTAIDSSSVQNGCLVALSDTADVYLASTGSANSTFTVKYKST